MDVPTDQKVYYTTRNVSAEARENRLAYSRAYYQSHKEDLLKRSNAKFSDLEYRQDKNDKEKLKYANNLEYRLHKQTYSRNRDMREKLQTVV